MYKYMDQYNIYCPKVFPLITVAIDLVKLYILHPILLQNRLVM